MTDAPPPANPAGALVERPTPTSEKTVACIVAAAFVELFAVVVLILWHAPPDKMTLYVGIVLVVLAVIPLLIALAFASPWLGTEKVSAGPTGVSVELNGSADKASSP